MIAIAPGINAAPPIPCMILPVISQMLLGDRAHMMEPNVKIATPIFHICFLPKRSLITPEDKIKAESVKA